MPHHGEASRIHSYIAHTIRNFSQQACHTSIFIDTTQHKILCYYFCSSVKFIKNGLYYYAVVTRKSV